MTEGDRFPEAQEKIAEMVEHGVEFLDETRPGWDRRVNLLLLDIRSPCNCVLGHVYGGFSEGKGVLHAWLTPGVLLTPRNAAEKCGFDIDNDLAEAYSVPSESYWDILLEEWKFLIRQRRENG